MLVSTVGPSFKGLLHASKLATRCWAAEMARTRDAPHQWLRMPNRAAVQSNNVGVDLDALTRAGKIDTWSHVVHKSSKASTESRIRKAICLASRASMSGPSKTPNSRKGRLSVRFPSGVYTS